MDIEIIGNGAFGSFLKQELPKCGFNIVDKAETVILAVPFSSYEAAAQANSGRYLINVCSMQSLSTQILLKYTDRVTGIHPLFGPRTPADKRFSIWTFGEFPYERNFIDNWKKFSTIVNDELTPEEHDRLMVKVHVAPILAAKQAKPFIDAAADIPDELIPNSFRLLRNFVKTLEDTPSGTIESIMANPYI